MVHNADPSTADWNRFKYMVFDIPNHPGPYEERYNHLGEWHQTAPKWLTRPAQSKSWPTSQGNSYRLPKWKFVETESHSWNGFTKILWIKEEKGLSCETPVPSFSLDDRMGI